MDIINISLMDWIINSRMMIANVIPTIPWILTTGSWVDASFWVDTDVWNDGV